MDPGADLHGGLLAHHAPPNFNCHNIGLDGLNMIAKALIPPGTSVLAGMCSAAVFRPPHTHIPLKAFSRNGASCLPDFVDFI